MTPGREHEHTPAMLKVLLAAVVALFTLWFAAPALGLPGWVLLVSLAGGVALAAFVFVRRES